MKQRATLILFIIFYCFSLSYAQSKKFKLGIESCPTFEMLDIGKIKNVDFKGKDQDVQPKIGFNCRILTGMQLSKKMVLYSGLHFGYNNLVHVIEHYNSIGVGPEVVYPLLNSRIKYREFGIPFKLEYKINKLFKIDFLATFLFIPRPEVDASFSVEPLNNVTSPEFLKKYRGFGSFQDVATKNVSFETTMSLNPNKYFGYLYNKISYGIGYEYFLIKDQLFFTESAARRNALFLKLFWQLN